VARRSRETFAPDELAIVLSHYELGVIESTTEFTRGSRRSPKVGIVCQRGKFLLKRRDPARGHVDRLRTVHALQHHLRARGFLLPAVVQATTGDSIVMTDDGRVYELFEYAAGHPYTGRTDETIDAGRVLAFFHNALDDFPADGETIHDAYHDCVAVQTGLNAVPGQVSAHGSAAGRDAEVLGLASFLFEAYTEAATAVDNAGYAEWENGWLHSDWHPGNLLFKRGAVLSVIDYDCVKWGKPICDLANDHLDMSRLAEFVGGYVERRPITEAQRRCLPHLMTEALIAEAVLPIAATGSFGPFAGFSFLRMIRRKVEWILEHAGQFEQVS